MAPAIRRRLVVLVALTAFVCTVAFAVADSIKVNAPRTDESQPETYAYFEGSSGAPSGPTGGEIGACVNGSYYGGRGAYTPPFGGDGEPFVGQTPCPEKTGDTTLPDDVTGGGEDPPVPCDSPETCRPLVEELVPDGDPPCSDPNSCEELIMGSIPGGGGGPAPPCNDQASCTELITGLIPDGGGTPGPPTMRDCTSASGGEATCFDFADGTYLVGDSPDDSQGELGLCTSSGYFYIAGPTTPGGDAGAACPVDGDTGGGDDGGGGTPAPPCSDQASCQGLIQGLVGGGAPGAPTMRDCISASGGEATCFDFGDGNYLVGDPPDDGQGELGFCTTSEQAPAGAGYYYVAGPSPDGDAGAECPAAPPAPPAPPADAGDPAAGGEAATPPPSDDGRPPTGSRPADPVEVPRIEITRERRQVSRRGYVRLPLACRAVQTDCIGELRLAATRRTRDGRRVGVLLAEATFRVGAGDTAIRRVRLTRRARLLLAARGEFRARARMALKHAGGTAVQRDAVVLRTAR